MTKPKHNDWITHLNIDPIEGDALRRIFDCATAYGLAVTMSGDDNAWPLHISQISEAIRASLDQNGCGVVPMEIRDWERSKIGAFTLRFGAGAVNIVASTDLNRSMLEFFGLSDIELPITDSDAAVAAEGAAGYFETPAALEHLNDYRSGAAREGFLRYSRLLETAIEALRSELAMSESIVGQASRSGHATNMAVNDYLRESSSATFRAVATMIGRAEVEKDTMLQAMLLIGTERGAARLDT